MAFPDEIAKICAILWWGKNNFMYSCPTEVLSSAQMHYNVPSVAEAPISIIWFAESQNGINY